MRYLCVGVAFMTALLLAGCGSEFARSSKTISNPWSANGQFGYLTATVAGDASETRLSAETFRSPANPNDALLAYSFGNSVDLPAYEGLEKVTFQQGIRLWFTFTPPNLLPSTVTLTGVSLTLWVRISDTSDDGTPRTATPLQFEYTGSLTLERQPDGSYVPAKDLLLTRKLGKAEATHLLGILGSGGDNDLTVDVSFTAGASPAEVPPAVGVQMRLELTSSRALVEW